jgi:hypothetical protein
MSGVTFAVARRRDIGISARARQTLWRAAPIMVYVLRAHLEEGGGVGAGMVWRGGSRIGER